MKAKFLIGAAAVLLGVGLYFLVRPGPTIEHHPVGIYDILLYDPNICEVRLIDPGTKEYQVYRVDTSFWGEDIRIFVDRGGENGPDTVKWKSNRWGDFEVE